MVVKYNLLKAKLVEKNLSIAAVSDAVGIKQRNLYRKISGTTCFTLQDISKIAKYLDLSDADTVRVFNLGRGE